MGIDHQKIVTANLRQATVLLSATVQATRLANGIMIANFKPRTFTSVFQILRVFADTGELIKLVVLPDTRQSCYDHVPMQYRMGANRNLITDNTIRTNDGSLINVRGR